MGHYNKLKTPSDLIRFKKSNFKKLSIDLNSSIKRKFITYVEKYKNYLRLIETNLIQSNLNKGYSIISKNKKIINKSKLISENDILNARLMDKTIKIKIKKIN